MTRRLYEEAGVRHVGQDKEVQWEDLMMAQRELNRHAAVVIKIFKNGKNWGPWTRVRETMMMMIYRSMPSSSLVQRPEGLVSGQEGRTTY